MLEQRRLNADGTLRRGWSCTRGKSFRIRLDVKGCVELDTPRLCVVSRRKRC
jgi:hypothetical protein